MLKTHKKVAKVSSSTITNLQEVQSIRPNDASSRCTGQKNAYTRVVAPPPPRVHITEPPIWKQELWPWAIDVAVAEGGRSYPPPQRNMIMFKHRCHTLMIQSYGMSLGWVPGVYVYGACYRQMNWVLGGGD